MQVLNSGITLYRRTIKRIQPLHAAVHWVVTALIFPTLEWLTAFRTMPDDPPWFRLELLAGRHETETIAHVRRLLKPGMTALDVGAHVGYYARLCAGLAGEEGRVVALEPHPRTFEVLTRNTRNKPQITTVQAAAGENEGTAELYDYLMMSASGSLHYDEALATLQQEGIAEGDIAPRLSGDFTVQIFEVRLTRLDTLLAEQGIEAVDFIKMDIEGAEIGALRGLRGTIGKSPTLTLIMEYNPHALRAFDHDPIRALDEVLALGFDAVYAIEADSALTDLTGQPDRIAALTDRLMDPMGVINLMFTRGEVPLG